LFVDRVVISVFISVMVIILLIVSVIKIKGPDLMLKIAFSLILGGAAGNLVDRIRFGYVIDFLDFRVWPVFNLADTAITIGAGLLIVYLFKMRNFKSRARSKSQ
jgi:signal peptidase II